MAYLSGSEEPTAPPPRIMVKGPGYSGKSGACALLPALLPAFPSALLPYCKRSPYLQLVP